MGRMRYWKITADEMGSISYDASKLANWEIKCSKSDGGAVGVFLYRKGTPYDYESIKGVCMYHNNIEKEMVGRIHGMLEGQFGGKRMTKGERIFLRNSKEPYSATEIGALAARLEKETGYEAAISLEFEGVTSEELAGTGMPESKLLPIPGG